MGNRRSLHYATPDFLLKSVAQVSLMRLLKESRMKIDNATKLNRKSGVARWRDLRFVHRSPA
jgi:hypothetical protein